MKTILVVDDEIGSAESLSIILEDEGYRTFCAANGQQGLEKVEEVRPDLVVLDFMMPVMNGVVMGQKLRADPRFSQVKLLFNTGLPESMVQQHFQGYDAFLRKPYDIDEALTLIRELIGN